MENWVRHPHSFSESRRSTRQFFSWEGSEGFCEWLTLQTITFSWRSCTIDIRTNHNCLNVGYPQTYLRMHPYTLTGIFKRRKLVGCAIIKSYIVRVIYIQNNLFKWVWIHAQVYIDDNGDLWFTSALGMPDLVDPPPPPVTNSPLGKNPHVSRGRFKNVLANSPFIGG